MEHCKTGLDVIEREARAIMDLASRLDKNFSQACELLLACKNRVVVTGMGKSGHIANKIAATLASTGTPAFFMHPGEASHGDFGMITEKDAVLAISNSGYTSEILVLLPFFQKLGVPLVSLCGNSESPLARSANVNLDVGVEEEACPFNLAPTTSTTTALVMGDAMAIAILKARGFTREDFAFSHPGGILGKRLLLKVGEISHHGADLPIVHENVTVSESLVEVTAKKLGMTCVVNDAGELSGVFTDGDIRRTLTRKCDINITCIREVMTRNPRTAEPDLLAAQALKIMQEYNITAIVLVENNKPVGVIHMHDLVRVGVF